MVTAEKVAAARNRAAGLTVLKARGAAAVVYLVASQTVAGKFHRVWFNQRINKWICDCKHGCVVGNVCAHKVAAADRADTDHRAALAFREMHADFFCNC